MYSGTAPYALASRAVAGVGWGGFTALTGGGDYDRDGRADLIARTAEGALLLYKGNGAGRFSGPFPLSTGWEGHLFIE